MIDELTQVMLIGLCGYATIRNPNAFAIQIAGARLRFPLRLFGTRSRKQRPVHATAGSPSGLGISVENTLASLSLRHQKRCHDRAQTSRAQCDASETNHRRRRRRFAVRGATVPYMSSHSAARARHKRRVDLRIHRRSKTVRNRPPAPKPAPCVRRRSDRRSRRTAPGRSRCGNNCLRATSRGNRELPIRPRRRPGLVTPSTSCGSPARGSMIKPIRFSLKSDTGALLHPDMQS